MRGRPVVRRGAGHGVPGSATTESRRPAGPARIAASRRRRSAGSQAPSDRASRRGHFLPAFRLRPRRYPHSALARRRQYLQREAFAVADQRGLESVFAPITRGSQSRWSPLTLMPGAGEAPALGRDRARPRQPERTRTEIRLRATARVGSVPPFEPTTPGRRADDPAAIAPLPLIDATRPVCTQRTRRRRASSDAAPAITDARAGDEGGRAAATTTRTANRLRTATDGRRRIRRATHPPRGARCRRPAAVVSPRCAPPGRPVEPEKPRRSVRGMSAACGTTFPS